jgi:hypothetical protein
MVEKGPTSRKEVGESEVRLRPSEWEVKKPVAESRRLPHSFSFSRKKMR